MARIPLAWLKDLVPTCLDAVLKTALIVLADGFEEIEAVAPIDILTRSGVNVTVAGLVQAPLRAVYGTTLVPDLSLDTAPPLRDAVVFAGGRRNAEVQAADRRAVELVHRHLEAGKIVARSAQRRVTLSERPPVYCAAGGRSAIRHSTID